jgi:putative spermidine/putrescine transport system ATP-binding protein
MPNKESIAGKSSGGAFLSLRSLTKRYDDFVAVDNITLDVPQGELVAFLGPSGCGKTTSLRMIAGLTPQSDGQIIVGGKNLTGVPTYRRDMGLVFQSYALFPHMTVEKNIAFGLEMRGVAREEIANRVREAVSLVHLHGMEARRPTALSGGQQQRVALARALVIRPSILLLDEPLSNLDAKLRDEMRNEIRDIQQRLGITAVFVTHDQAEALTMCDKVVVMNRGKLEQIGTPIELYEQPRTEFVAEFIGRMNRIRVDARNGYAEFAGQRLIVPAGLAGVVNIMVRPHRVAIGASQEEGPYRFEGTIRRAIFVGDILQYDVDVGGQVISVEVGTRGGEQVLAPGSAVSISWRRQDVCVFGGQS